MEFNNNTANAYVRKQLETRLEMSTEEMLEKGVSDSVLLKEKNIGFAEFYLWGALDDPHDNPNIVQYNVDMDGTPYFFDDYTTALEFFNNPPESQEV